VGVVQDLILSSGFLAFAAHCGFLAAVEEADLPVGAVCGTSSGALVGALWSAGMPAREILADLAARRPIAWAAPHVAIWRGAFRLDRVEAGLRERLPADFSGLRHPFAAGVAVNGAFRLQTAGPLAAAVAASCAVPYLFAPMALDGEHLSDGGAVDRLGLDAWRRWRPGARPLVHQVERSAGATRETSLEGIPVVRSARSGASLWSLGDPWAAFEASRAAARQVLGPRG
jgi:predicted acylesterase/phospholipase RssA